MGKSTRLVSTTTRTPLGVTHKQVHASAAVSTRKQQHATRTLTNTHLSSFQNRKLDHPDILTKPAYSNRLCAGDMANSSAETSLHTDDDYATSAGNFGFSSNKNEYDSSAPRLRTLSYSSDLDGSGDDHDTGTGTALTGSTTLCSYPSSGQPLLRRSQSMRDLTKRQDLPVLSLSDDTLHDMYKIKPDPVAAGNWGRVYLARVRKPLGFPTASFDGSIPGYVALKVVDRQSDDGVSCQRTMELTLQAAMCRVRALWGEMKIMKRLLYEPHPNVIQFDAFILTETSAV